MIERRTCTVHGPKTWERVREAYAAGMTAGEIERVYGVKPGALRQRAFREGWSRTAVARAEEASSPTPPPSRPPPCTPQEAIEAAVARASAELAAGRASEAVATLKAAETLHRLMTEIEAARAKAAVDAAAAEEEFAAWIEHRAVALAQAMLNGETEAVRPAHATAAVLWWAQQEAELGEDPKIDPPPPRPGPASRR